MNLSLLSLATTRITGSGAGTDPFFSMVSLLLHGNGADGSTTCIDSSRFPNTFTTVGNAQIDTAQSKFGGASMLFDGNGDSFQTPANSSFNLGIGDFTVECFVRFATLPASNLNITGQGSNTGTDSTISFDILKTSTHKILARARNGSTVIGACTSTASVSLGVWHHLAYVRSGSDFRLYIDGVNDGGASSTLALNSSSNKVGIGSLGEYMVTPMNGWIDEYRLTKGVARYTSNFTPPTTAFPDS